MDSIKLLLVIGQEHCVKIQIYLYVTWLYVGPAGEIEFSLIRQNIPYCSLAP